MIVYKVKTEDGNEHYSADPGQVLNAIGRHLERGGKITAVKVEGMSEGAYNSIPAGSPSAEFFKLN